MIQFPHDDDDQLINFLKQHRPLPPPAKAQFEDQLLELIRREPVSLPKQPSYIPLFWLLFSTIAASLLIVLGNYRWFNAAPKMTTASDQELETFLINSWDTTIGETPYTAQPTSPESTLIILSEPPTAAYSYSHP